MPVNGIELKEGQIWKTKNYGIVTLSDSGVNAHYPWRMTSPNNGDPISSITTDGKYWDEEDEMPELLECIYNPEDKGEKKPMKFNPKSEPTKFVPPKPGDKIICNNGEEFICCTLDFLYAKGIRPSKPQAILGFDFVEETWQDWDEDGYASLAPEYGYDIREVIPQISEVTAHKKEEVKEESRYKAATAEQPLYTVEEVFDAIFEVTKHLEIEIPWGYIDDVKEYLSRIKDPQYLEYLRLKAIYE